MFPLKLGMKQRQYHHNYYFAVSFSRTVSESLPKLVTGSLFCRADTSVWFQFASPTANAAEHFPRAYQPFLSSELFASLLSCKGSLYSLAVSLFTSYIICKYVLSVF